MNFFSKLIIVIIVVLSLMYIKDTFFADGMDGFNFLNKGKTTEEEVWQPSTPQEEPVTEEPNEEKVKISLYFTTTTSSSLKKVTREMPQGSSKLNFAVKQLLKGPTAEEKKAGFSSEIPKSVKLLGIKDQGSLIIIDLSDEFQYGGGTESQYTRLNQLIKTGKNCIFIFKRQKG